MTTSIIILISVFVILYICIVASLEHMEFFRDAKFVLAFPVSVLCVLSMLRGGSPIELVRVSYKALGYAIIFVLILWLLSRVHLWIHKHFGDRLLDWVFENEERWDISKVVEKYKNSRKRDDRIISNKEDTLARLKEEQESRAIKK